MQSDTLIGIVGAVVLVSVMVGVFAYEFNNTPDEGTDPAEEKASQMALFNDTFPGMDPMGDLDGDGTPNYNDTDMDGDDVPDVDENGTVVDDIKQSFDAGGSVTMGPPSSGYSLSFTAAPGVGHVVLELSHTGTLEQLGQQQPALSVALVDPTGFSNSATVDFAGSTITYTVHLTSDVAPGEYVLNVEPFNPSGMTPLYPDTSVTGEIEFHYAI